jgi:hypothetical protein
VSANETDVSEVVLLVNVPTESVGVVDVVEDDDLLDLKDDLA